MPAGPECCSAKRACNWSMHFVAPRFRKRIALGCCTDTQGKHSGSNSSVNERQCCFELTRGPGRQPESRLTTHGESDEVSSLRKTWCTPWSKIRFSKWKLPVVFPNWKAKTDSMKQAKKIAVVVHVAFMLPCDQDRLRRNRFASHGQESSSWLDQGGADLVGTSRPYDAATVCISAHVRASMSQITKERLVGHLPIPQSRFNSVVNIAIL